MSLRSTFATLYAEAAARERDGLPGEAYKALKGGADIKVRTQGRRRQVILGRRPPAPRACRGSGARLAQVGAR